MQETSPVDPEGCQRRSWNKLKGRKYITCGPNDTWHIDGNDKLKQFGFYVHQAIDEYSTKILLLRVGNRNKDTKIALSYLLGYVAEGNKNIPRQIAGKTTTCKDFASSFHFFILPET